jgi:hypothetical protein
MVQLEIDRHDPENREFRHPDPIGWTDGMRAEILRAFYTILLGNPTLKLPRNAPMKTRFKMWWRLVGSAVEHAAKLATERAAAMAMDSTDKLARPCEVDFRTLFMANEDENEDDTSLADALSTLAETFPDTFSAAEVAVLVNDGASEAGCALREFLYPAAPPGHHASPKSVGLRLKKHIDGPVKHGDQTLILRRYWDDGANRQVFKVEQIGIG